MSVTKGRLSVSVDLEATLPIPPCALRPGILGVLRGALVRAGPADSGDRMEWASPPARDLQTNREHSVHWTMPGSCVK
jgi:hypothetical protein